MHMAGKLACERAFRNVTTELGYSSNTETIDSNIRKVAPPSHLDGRGAVAPRRCTLPIPACETKLINQFYISAS